MRPYLYLVAETFYQKYGSGISDFTFVFPSRRAGKFFQKQLSECADKTIFSPKLLTIGDLVQQETPFAKPDRMNLLLLLHEIFRSCTKSAEPFDKFLFLGEMLLGDFDDADKYLIDIEQLFGNLKDLKEIENRFFPFTEEQLQAIRTFWGSFAERREKSENEQKFIDIWQKLNEIYNIFNQKLKEKNWAYEGMIYRQIVGRIAAGETLFSGYGKLVFVGFNALNNCEYKIFDYLKKNHNVDFYWDYTSPFVRDEKNPASLFVKKNTTLFQPKLDLRDDNPHETKFHLIETSSSVGQAKEIGRILDQMDKKSLSENLSTAVMLPDENLLLPLLYSLPSDIAHINITMGYPLPKTPVAALMEYIFALHRNARRKNGQFVFYHRDVAAILNHQYIKENYDFEANEILNKIKKQNLVYISEKEFLSGENALLKAIFLPEKDISESPKIFFTYLINILENTTPTKSENPENSGEDVRAQLQREFVYQYILALKRAKDILADTELEPRTLVYLIRQFVAGVSVPFSGEPLKGLQIMGVLETRNLDFDTLIIPCMNEGVFPRIAQGKSFIPYNLRRYFDLPTGEHIDSVYAYHFYRLIHRAKNVYFLYNSTADGLQTGEVSRFVSQLKYLYGKEMNESVVTFDITKPESEDICIEKSGFVQENLEKFLSENKEKSLSASAINTYINCPLRFCLENVFGWRDDDEVKEDIESDSFGTIFHNTMQLIYSPMRGGKMVDAAFFDSWLNDRNHEKIFRTICEVYARNIMKMSEKDAKNITLEGQPLLTVNILKKFVVKTLETDRASAPFTYIDSEKKFQHSLPISGGRTVNLKGFIDRIDKIGTRTRILDYKTGSFDKKRTFESVESLFDPTDERRKKEILQVLFYALCLADSGEIEAADAEPGLIFIRELFKNPDFGITQEKEPLNFKAVADDFRAALKNCLEEIFDPKTPFAQTTLTDYCQHCNFINICKR